MTSNFLVGLVKTKPYLQYINRFTKVESNFYSNITKKHFVLCHSFYVIYSTQVQTMDNFRLSKPKVIETIKIAELAHELKLPLFNIKSFLETLYEHYFNLTDNQKLEFIETANKETNRLIVLIQNLVESETIYPRLGGYNKNFAISKLVSQIITTYKLTAINKNVNLVYKYKKISCDLTGNPNIISQVITNLIGNSLKYTFPKRRIFLRTRAFTSLTQLLSKKCRLLHISVSDEGIGITRQRIQIILGTNSYSQIRNSSNVVKGSCLGLHIVKQLLLSHKSQLNILSKVKIGSLIGFYLYFHTKTLKSW